MSDLMYYCTFAALRCSLGFAWTIITLIKSTSLEESGQRQRKGERGDMCLCVSIICVSVCVCILVGEYVSVCMQVTIQEQK